MQPDYMRSKASPLVSSALLFAQFVRAATHPAHRKHAEWKCSLLYSVQGRPLGITMHHGNRWLSIIHRAASPQVNFARGSVYFCFVLCLKSVVDNS